MRKINALIFGLALLFGGATHAQSISVAATPSCQEEVLTIDNASQVITRVDWLKDGVNFYSEDSYLRTDGLLIGGGSQGGLSSQMRFPQDLAHDNAGRTYVVDKNNNRVIRWSPGGTQGVVLIGSNGPGSGLDQLRNPHGIFRTNNGSLYIADRHNHRVVRWDDGAIQGVVVSGGNGPGNALNQLDNPTGVVVASNGDVYVSDMRNNRVVKWGVGEATGVVVAGGNGHGNNADQFREPMGLDIDGANTIYVADRKNNRIMMWASGAVSGVVVTGGLVAGTGLDDLNNPMDVQLDPDNNMYVADYGNHRVMKYAPGASIGSLITNQVQGNTLEQLSFPTGISIDSLDGVYITDSWNHRTVKWGIQLPSLTYVTDGDASYSASITLKGGGGIITNSVGYLRIPLPVSSYSSVRSNMEYTFTNASTNGTSYLWEFGDGTTSTSADPVHNFMYTGTYEVCLNAYDDCGHVDIFCDTYVIITDYASEQNDNLFLHENSWCNNSPLDILGVEQLLVQQTKWFRDGVAFTTSNLSYASSGSQVAGSTSQGGQNYQLRFPQQVQVVGNDMYIVDRNNNRILKWALGAGSGTVVAGGVNQGPFAAMNRLRDPRTVIADVAGNMYILDRNNHRVLYWPTGAAAASAVVAGGNGPGIGLNQLKDPSDMALYNGALYIVDEDNHRIVKWVLGDIQGSVIAGETGITGATNSLLNNPVGLDVDADGSVYVADMENSRVLRFDPGQTEGVLVAGGNAQGGSLNQLSKPYDVQVDGAKNIFVIDRENHRIVKYEPFEKVGIVVAGGNGEGDANNQFDFPTGFFIEGNRIYVADNNNHRIMRWNINFPSMSDITSETVQVDADYHVEITMTDGTMLSSDTENFTHNVVVADYAFSVNDLDLTLTNNSIHGETYAWNFADGATSTSETPSNHYRYNGTYNVCLTTTDSCSKSDVSCQNVVINAPLDVVFAAADLDPLSMIAGCGQRDLKVRGVFVAADIASINWKKNGITYSTTGAGDSTHITDGTGDYTAEIIFVDATSLTTPTIRSYTQDPAVSADWSHVVTGAGDIRTTTFTNSSSANTSFVWNFDDGSAANTTANPVHVYVSPGIYNVSLTATDSCGLQDVSIQAVTIETYAVTYAAAALSIPSNSDCDQQTISVTGIIDNGDVSSTQWFKDAVSEGAAAAGLTTHNTTNADNVANNYTATVIFTDGSSLNLAAVNFNYLPATAGYTSLVGGDFRTTTFTNTSINSVSYSWDFGDGSAASIDVNPVHMYANPGSYTVVLTATDACAGTDVSSQTVTILTYAAAYVAYTITIPNVSNCLNETMSTAGIADLNHISSIEWFKDGGSQNVVAGPAITENTAGSGAYTSIVTFTDGSSLNSTNTVNFSLDVAIANWSQGVTNLLEVNFVNTSSNGVSYLWDFNDALATSTDENPIHTFSGAGTYNVCLTTTDACGGTNQLCADVTVVAVRVDNPNGGSTGQSQSSLELDEWTRAISLYPNPSSDIISLDLTGAESNIQLMDANGRILSIREGGESHMSFDLSNLANGMYMFVISTDKGTITKRALRN